MFFFFGGGGFLSRGMGRGLLTHARTKTDLEEEDEEHDAQQGHHIGHELGGSCHVVVGGGVFVVSKING